MIVELSFMFIIILGRWILPKGNISHSALSQLLLVYLSLASDILDLLTLFGEQEIYLSLPMVRVVLTVFSLCMFQFAFNLTATRGRAFYAEFDDEAEIQIRQPSRPVHRKVLDKILPRSKSASTPQPFALAAPATLSPNQLRPRAASFSITQPPDTSLEDNPKKIIGKAMYDSSSFFPWIFSSNIDIFGSRSIGWCSSSTDHSTSID